MQKKQVVYRIDLGKKAATAICDIIGTEPCTGSDALSAVWKWVLDNKLLKKSKT